MHKSISFTIRGLSPLLMHNPQLANPRNPIVIEMKKLTAKRTKKTEEDLDELSRLEFMGGLYLGSDKSPVVPGEAIEGMMNAAARGVRKGKDAKAGLLSDAGANVGWKLHYTGPKTAEELWADANFVDVRAVSVNKAKIMRTRPIFHSWSLDFDVQYLPDVLSESDIRDWVTTAGRIIGLLDYRPRYGRFEVV